MLDSLSHTSIFGTDPNPDSNTHTPATKSPVVRVGNSNAMTNPENAATIVNTGGSDKCNRRISAQSSTVITPSL